MSTAALWSGWQAFRSGPLPGPLAPASPAAVGGPLDQLVFHSSTGHYHFFYPANHAELGIQPGLLDEVTAHVEDDYALLESWFGVFPALTDIYVIIYDEVGGGVFGFGDSGQLIIEVRDNLFPYPETLRTMILHETAHAFEWQTDLASGVAATDDTGWFYAENGPGGTRSEILCRFLHSVFLAENLGAADSGWINGDAYGVAQTWLNSARTDYVNTAATSSGSPSAITGCGVLFLYYLRDQLGYTIPQIIAAGRLADTLADIYETLSGDSADPFPVFKGLIDGAFPLTLFSAVAGENPENPFPIGASILTDTLPGAVIIVQAAWGADIATWSALWPWDDITRDVRQSDGNTITVTAGRGDEAEETQPAQAAMLLDNRAGRYALGGQNPLYPYLRRNTPIRVSVSLDYGITWTVLFFGYADGWSPDWDATGRDAVVRLSASGVLRRLLQGEAPPVSAFRRYVEGFTTALPIVYWPMEDGGGSTSFAPAIGGDSTGQYTMTANTNFDPPKAAANSDFLCSFPLPTLGGCELYGPVPWRAATGTLSVTALVAFPDSGLIQNQPLLFLDVSGSSDWWWLAWQDVDGGQLIVNCQDRYGNVKANTAYDFDGLAGGRGMVQLDLVQDGSDIDYALTWVAQGTDLGYIGSGTCTSRTLGYAQAVYLNTYIDEVDDGVAPAEIITPSSAELVFGHVTVRNATVQADQAVPYLTGYDGEGTGNRLVRLLTVANQPIDVYTPTFLPATPATAEADVMGPQTAAPLLDLLREIEQVDGGILFDGYGSGLSFMPRVSLLARPASLFIDAAEGHLLDPFHPDDDDQTTVNRVTVVRATGSTVTAEDTDSPLGSNVVGLYDTSVDVNTYTDAGAAQHAAWRVHLGTVAGYRYPTVTFDLAKSPDLAASWVGRPIGARIDVRNLLDARTQHPGGDLPLMLQGFTQQISQKRWTVEANCSLFDPWLVGQIAPAAGAADGPDQLDTTTSVLSQFAAPNATEVRVTVADGPDWTVDPGDYPIVLDVGGMPVTVESGTAATTDGAGGPVVVGNQLEDDFDDNSIDPILWPTNSGTVAESGGKAQVTADAAGTWSYYQSAAAYALADSTLTARITVPSLETSTFAESFLSMYSPAAGFNTYASVYGRVVTGDTVSLGLIAVVNEQVAINTAVAWSPTTYPWVRLRELGGVLTVEASADGVAWLIAIRDTTPVALREATALTVALEARRSAIGAAGTPATFDNVSLTRTTRVGQTFTVGGGLVVDDFADGVVNDRLWPYAAGTYSEPGDGTVEVTATIDGLTGGLVTDARYNLIDTTFSAKVAPPSAEDSAIMTRGQLSVQIGAVTNYSIVAYVDSKNNLYGWYSYAAGVLQWHAAGSLSGNPYLWLQIRTVGDVVQLRQGVDGVNWVTALEEPLNSIWTQASSAAFGLTAARSVATTAGNPAVFESLRIERAGFDSMLTAKRAGSAVKLWRPPILAL